MRNGRQIGACPFDLSRTWQKTQHLPARPRQYVADSFDDRLPFGVFDGERMERARHLHDRRVTEKSRDAVDVERRRHHDDAQIVAREPCLTRQREPDVRMNASLVKLVEHDRREIRQQRILLKARRQDAFGDDEQARVSREMPVESNLPAYFAADRPLAFFGDPTRHGARRRRGAAAGE